MKLKQNIKRMAVFMRRGSRSTAVAVAAVVVLVSAIGAGCIVPDDELQSGFEDSLRLTQTCAVSRLSLLAYRPDQTVNLVILGAPGSSFSGERRYDLRGDSAIKIIVELGRDLVADYCAGADRSSKIVAQYEAVSGTVSFHWVSDRQLAADLTQVEFRKVGTEDSVRVENAGWVFGF